MEKETDYRFKLLADAELAYYEGGDTGISDVVYDEMVSFLEPDRTSFLDNINPNPFLSLKKEKDLDKLLKFFDFDAYKYAGQRKIDGLAAALFYSGGELVEVRTRGGKSILNRVRKSVPHNITEKSPVEIRGELFVSKLEFENFKDDYATPRSLAAGYVLSNHNIDVKLSFAPYQAFGLGITNDALMIELLEYLNFETAPLNTKLVLSTDDVLQYVNSGKELDSAIPSDGIVFKVVDYVDRYGLGQTAKYPVWAVAFKYVDDIHTTTVLDIEFNKGKTGRITPVAKLAPVKIGGVIVKSVNLYSMRNFELLGICPGDPVKLVLANGVIPQIISKVD